jgi:hypothetical protein
MRLSLFTANGRLTTDNTEKRSAPVVTGAPLLLQGVEETYGFACGCVFALCFL